MHDNLLVYGKPDIISGCYKYFVVESYLITRKPMTNKKETLSLRKLAMLMVSLWFYYKPLQCKTKDTIMNLKKRKYLQLHNHRLARNQRSRFKSFSSDWTCKIAVLVEYHNYSRAVLPGPFHCWAVWPKHVILLRQYFLSINGKKKKLLERERMRWFSQGKIEHILCHEIDQAIQFHWFWKEYFEII